MPIPALVTGAVGALNGLAESGLGAAGLGVATNFLNYRSQKKAIQAQLEANMKLAQYQFDRNVEMWNLQNEYNTPANQMLRYQEAGLNPHLVAGQGSSGNSSSAPTYQAPQVDRAEMKFDSLIGNLMQAVALKQAKAQADKTDAEVAGQNISNQMQAAQYNEYMTTAAYRDNIRNNQLAMEAMDIAVKKLIQDEKDLGIRMTENRWRVEYQKALQDLIIGETQVRIAKATEDAEINKAISGSIVAQNQADASKYLSRQAESNLKDTLNELKLYGLRRTDLENKNKISGAQAVEAEIQSEIRDALKYFEGQNKLRQFGFFPNGAPMTAPYLGTGIVGQFGQLSDARDMIEFLKQNPNYGVSY